MRKSIIPTELHSTVRKEREGGVSNIDLCIKYEVSIKAIQRITKGIKPPPVVYNREFLNPEEVYQKYKEVGSLEKLSRVYRKSTTALKKLLKKNEYIWDKEKDARTIQFNTSYFKQIDTEEKAYWLGFLYADGSIKSKGWGITCTLQERDRVHIEKLAKCIEYPGKIQTVQSMNACSIAIYSKEMHQDLVSKGCISNKTFQLKYPTEEQVPKQLTNHFIRGYFDGDGCITESKQQTFSIVGIQSFIERIQEILMKEVGLNKTKLYKHKGKDCYSVLYGGKNDIMKIANYLYKEATVYMERKYNKFKWQK